MILTKYFENSQLSKKLAMWVGWVIAPSPSPVFMSLLLDTEQVFKKIRHIIVFNANLFEILTLLYGHKLS